MTLFPLRPQAPVAPSAAAFIGPMRLPDVAALPFDAALALGHHLAVSRALRGPMFSLRCAAEALNQGARSHVISGLTLLCLTAAILWASL